MQSIFYLLESGAATPIYQAITLLGPYAMGVVALLSMIYGIVLGVRLAKAEDVDERKKIQKTLVNFVIGAISVFILLVVLYAIRDYV